MRNKEKRSRQGTKIKKIQEIIKEQRNLKKRRLKIIIVSI